MNIDQLTKPITNIEYRTPHEVFDIMADRIRSALSVPLPEIEGGDKGDGWKWVLVPDYPEGNVVGPCICGSWPGGPCLKCPPIEGETP